MAYRLTVYCLGDPACRGSVFALWATPVCAMSVVSGRSGHSHHSGSTDGRSTATSRNSSAPSANALKWVALGAGNAPSGRWGHTVTRVTSNHVVMVGGIAGGKIFNDTSVYDITSQRWMQPAVSGTPPTGRWGHSATLVEAEDGALKSDSLVVLGGREGSKPMPFSEMYVLDLTTFEWVRKAIEGPTPRNRYAHSAVFIKDLSQVGWCRGAKCRKLAPLTPCAVVASLRVFPDHRVWRPWWPHSVLPRYPHAGHADIPLVHTADHWTRPFQAQWPRYDRNKVAVRWVFPLCTYLLVVDATHLDSGIPSLVVFGGFNGSSILADMFVFSLHTYEWTQLSLGGPLPLPAVYGHSMSAVPHSNAVVIFGGCLSAAKLSARTYWVDLASGTAVQVLVQEPPPSRFWHDVCVSSTKLYVFGGSGSKNNALEDVAMLDFFETTPVKPEALSRRALVFPRGVHALLLRVISVCTDVWLCRLGLCMHVRRSPAVPGHSPCCAACAGTMSGETSPTAGHMAIGMGGMGNIAAKKSASSSRRTSSVSSFSSFGSSNNSQASLRMPPPMHAVPPPGLAPIAPGTPPTAPGSGAGGAGAGTGGVRGLGGGIAITGASLSGLPPTSPAVAAEAGRGAFSFPVGPVAAPPPPVAPGPTPNELKLQQSLYELQRQKLALESAVVQAIQELNKASIVAPSVHVDTASGVLRGALGL